VLYRVADKRRCSRSDGRSQLVEAQLSQDLVHLKERCDAAQALPIPLHTRRLEAPPGSSRSRPDLIDHVDNDRSSLWRHDDVRGRQVSMHDTRAMQGAHAGGDPFDDLTSRSLRT
jgi:hypothetical protein